MGKKRGGDVEDDGDDAKRLKPEEEVEDDEEGGSEEEEEEDSDEDDSDEEDSDEDDEEDSSDDDDSDDGEELELTMREDGRVHAPAVDSLALDTFRTFPDLIQGLDEDKDLHTRILADCRRVFTARSVKKKAGKDGKKTGRQYSSGETFWISAEATPRCALEHLAQQIFHLHVTDAARKWEDECGDDANAPPPFDPHRSGAEWWTQIIDPTHDAIGLHWDKDYALERNDLNVHPHVGTVTYLADTGAPTMFVRATTPVYYSQPVTGAFGPMCCEDEDDFEDPPPGPGVYLSWPKKGKHAAFDGRWLHGAPSELAECGDDSGSEDGDGDGGDGGGVKGKGDVEGDVEGGKGPRVTFLVNVWLNHVPASSAPCPEDVVKDLSAEPFLPEVENPDDVDEDPPAMFSVMGNYQTVFKEMSWEFEHDGRTHALRVPHIPERWVSREAGGNGCALGDGVSVAIVGGCGEVMEKHEK